VRGSPAGGSRFASRSAGLADGLESSGPLAAGERTALGRRARLPERMPETPGRLLDIPAGAKGSYLLHLCLAHEHVVVVEKGPRHGGGTTRSRTFVLSQGHYLYVGSAFGPGGLGSRVGRHLSLQPKRRHWDIDFLLSGRPRPALVEAWGLASNGAGDECRWATIIARSSGVVPLVGRLGLRDRRDRGFGAGDCRNRCGCRSDSPATSRTHLFGLAWRPTLRGMRQLLGVPLVRIKPTPIGGGAPWGMGPRAPSAGRAPG